MIKQHYQDYENMFSKKKKKKKKEGSDDFLLFPLRNQGAKAERINKETGELSASGELSVSLELKTEKVEGFCGNPQLLQVFREQLLELGIHTWSSRDARTDHVPLEQREELLVKVLPLYIQVWTNVARMCILIPHLL